MCRVQRVSCCVQYMCIIWGVQEGPTCKNYTNDHLLCSGSSELTTLHCVHAGVAVYTACMGSVLCSGRSKQRIQYYMYGLHTVFRPVLDLYPIFGLFYMLWHIFALYTYNIWTILYIQAYYCTTILTSELCECSGRSQLCLWPITTDKAS